MLTVNIECWVLVHSTYTVGLELDKYSPLTCLSLSDIRQWVSYCVWLVAIVTYQGSALWSIQHMHVQTQARTSRHACAHKHTYTRARTHAHTHTLFQMLHVVLACPLYITHTRCMCNMHSPSWAMKSEIQPCPTSTKAGTGTYITTGKVKSMLCHTCISIIPMCVLVYYSHGSVLYSTPHPAEGCTIRRGAVTHNTQPMHWATMQHLRGLMLKQSMLFTLKKCKNTTFWKPVNRKPFKKNIDHCENGSLSCTKYFCMKSPSHEGQQSLLDWMIDH